MRRSSKGRWLMFAALSALATPIACDAGGIVGGECRSGTTRCGERCANLRTDADNCGECGTVCERGLVCGEGQCVPPGGAGGTGGGFGGDAGSSATGGTDPGGEGGIGGTTPGGGRGPTGGTSGLGGSSMTGEGGEGGSVCYPPYDSAEACGDCDTQCVDPSPLCAPTEEGGYECVPECEPPLVACGDRCVDTNVHPLHCGGCNNVCPSGICQAGMCVGATTGHVALMCMDYYYAQQQSAHTVLLGNAVFLPIRSEVRVLSFDRWAPFPSKNQVDRVIAWSAAARGRSVEMTSVSAPAQLSSQLSIQNFDVFLVHDQSSAPSGELAEVGSAWATTGVLDSFARAGGVIVVLDGAQGTGEMAEFMNAAGLLDIDGHQPIAIDDTTTRFYNRAPGDALGINVVSPLSPVPYSCVFDTPAPTSNETVFVVTDAEPPATGAPVVVHRIVAP